MLLKINVRILMFIAILYASVLQGQVAHAQAKTEGDCSSIFQYLKTSGGSIRITASCNIYRNDPSINNFIHGMYNIQREEHLSTRTMELLVQATNLIGKTILSHVDVGFAKLSAQLINAVSHFSRNKPDEILPNAQVLKERYEKLLDQWQVVQGTSMLDKQAYQAIQDLDLDRAGKILDTLIEEQNPGIQVAAQRYYHRAQVFQLQFKPLEALGAFQRAYQLNPENTDYAFSYASALDDENHFGEAIPLFEEVLKNCRFQFAKEPSIAHQHDLAMTLNNLGIVYYETHRYPEAEAAVSEALTIIRQLAKKNPAAYMPDLAGTLINLGNLYDDTHRYLEAEAAYIEALTIRRQLANQNPQAYAPYLANTLNNVGDLYVDTHRYPEAEAAMSEALRIRRRLAKDNPQAYAPDLATTLNNLGTIYDETHRYAEAEAAESEALTILRQLAKENPAAYTPNVAMTLNNLGNPYNDTHRYPEAEAAYGEALTIWRKLAKENPAAYTPMLARTLRNLARLYRTIGKTVESKALEHELQLLHNP